MRKNRPFALALAGTIAFAGQTALMASPAAAMTPVSQLKDVSPDHWSYHALRTLIDKYKVMEGFPDKTFRGSKTLTRYEMAAALARLMARVEERIAIATGQPINVDPGVNPEDLRTIARLQREFREELDQLKARVDTIDSRVQALEKRVKVSGSHRTDYRDWVNDPVLPGTKVGAMTAAPSADFRFRNVFNLDGQLNDETSFTSTLNADLYAPQSIANAYLRGNNAGGNPIMDVYVPRANITYAPSWATYTVGVGALRDHLPLGSATADMFKRNNWANGTGGFGFVGTPGLNPAGAGTALAFQGTAGGFGAGAPLWLPGTNVIVDMLDPNNSSIYGPHGDLLSAGHFAFGPLHIGLGFSRGGLSGPILQGGTPALAASLPSFTNWAAGSKATATAGLDFGLVRLNAVAQGPGTSAAFDNVRNSSIGASLDLGNESLALTAEVLGNSSLSLANWSCNRASLRLGACNILDTGFGLGAGYVAGNIVTLTGSTFNTSANNLFGNPDFNSLGLTLKTPAFLVIPSFTVAAQQSGGAGGMFSATSNAVASGLTLQTDLNLFALPTLTVEYSRGKFGGAGDQSLFGANPFTHDQIGLSTTVKF